jgi:hypothetical protein
MATINSETKVEVTMKQLYGAAAVLLVGGLAGLWAVLNFTIGGLREDAAGLRGDVTAIRTDIGKLQESALATPGKLSDAQLALSKEISGLRVDLEAYHGDIKVIKASLDSLASETRNKK